MIEIAHRGRHSFLVVELEQITDDVILSLDTDKFVDFLFCKSDTPPSADDFKMFAALRNYTFWQAKEIPQFIAERSPLPLTSIIYDQIKQLKEEVIFSPHFERELVNLVNGQPTIWHGHLAVLIGTIDYVQYVENDLGAAPATPVKEKAGKESGPRILTLEQRAIIHVYDNICLDKDNAPGFAAEYGHKYIDAGKKLLQLYNKYRIPNNRTGLEKIAASGAQTKSLNKVKRIRAIVPHLSSEDAKVCAKDEADLLEFNIENHLP